METHSEITGIAALPDTLAVLSTTQPVKAVLFDFGGTLDTGGIHWADFFAGLYAREGLFCDEGMQFFDAYVATERLLESAPPPPSTTFSRLITLKINSHLRLAGLSDEFVVERILQRCMALVEQNIALSAKVLKRLKEDGYRLGLVSNFYGNLAAVVDSLGLCSIFSALIDSVVEKVRKPDAELWSRGLAALGIQPAETVVVGDSMKNDILPARSLGCRAVQLKPTESATSLPKI